MVEVFKTNVIKESEADNILTELKEEFPHLKINFDLDDCDKILRVEGNSISFTQIIQFFKLHNYQCNMLE